MKKIKFSNLKASDLKTHEELCNSFKKYLCDTMYYLEAEADFVVEEDFEDPYMTPYVMQDYIEVCEIEGALYEVRECRTDFSYCGFYHYSDTPPFEFYMLIDEATLPDSTVGSYHHARKMYYFFDENTKK